MSAPEELTPDSFYDIYGPDAAILTPGGSPATLGYAKQMEELACMADADKRSDPELRKRYMAKMLFNAGSLHEEHYYLLENQDS
jgi:hypothetical protein